ncbi:MAG TPA: hypothetical protein VKA64_09575 [Gammaproteobacteria bacterium]|nr:hypothetical protein [Gammaproteobacteria bacterium]
MPSLYRIDRADVITAVNADWDAFAAENAGDQLSARHVLGRVLWEFISDPETTQIYRGVFHRLREGAVVPPLPFRCDSPTLRRFMELRMRAVQDGALELEARLLRAEPREAVALLETDAERDAGLLRICGWCKRVAVAEGDWREVEEAVRQLGLLERYPLPALTHTMCGDCLARLYGCHEDDDDG